jgi:hypothetical protein
MAFAVKPIIQADALFTLTLANQLCKLIAIHAGHVTVGNDHIDICFFPDSQRLMSRRRKVSLLS